MLQLLLRYDSLAAYETLGEVWVVHGLIFLQFLCTGVNMSDSALKDLNLAQCWDFTWWLSLSLSLSLSFRMVTICAVIFFFQRFVPSRWAISDDISPTRVHMLLWCCAIPVLLSPALVVFDELPKRSICYCLCFLWLGGGFISVSLPINVLRILPYTFFFTPKFMQIWDLLILWYIV
jgi:hypothetical protein